ncbi:hypothetical protein GF351_02150 [Candidatus Woesearchaeota archaeon]|nr:hypothetical protein [Candidatus Woesearchaeota archaeon]
MNIHPVLQIFMVGAAILAGAIILNLLAGLIGVATWYTFAADMQYSGFFHALRKQGLNLLWLFVIYPLLLGLIGYYTAKVFL